MKNPGCQDILRHGSPFRQGGCQSSTALWDRWTHPRCLQLSEQTSTRYLLSWGIPLFLLGSFSASSPYFEIPQLDQLSSPSLFPWFCLLPSSCIDPRHQQRGPIYPGDPVWARPPLNSSLCAAAGKRSNSVSAYCILQESCYLLTVLLQIKKVCLHPS